MVQVNTGGGVGYVLRLGPVTARATASLIPRNDVGMPVFPCVDLGAATPTSVRHLLREYFTECGGEYYSNLMSH
jgi:hypothetical protein